MNISEYRTQFASFNSSLGLARYKDHVGLKSEPDNEEIYDRYNNLFSTDSIAELKSQLDQTPANLSTEKSGLERLLIAAQLGHVERQASELTKELVQCEFSSRIDWNGEKISLEDVPGRLARESKRTRRSELAARWADSIAVCNELRVSCLESFRESARRLGFSSYGDLIAEATNTKLDHVQPAAQSLLEQTEPAYRSALAKLIACDFPDLKVRDLDFADRPYFEAMPWREKFFSTKNLLRAQSETMNGLGIRLDKQPNIQLDTEPRPFRKAAAACFPVHPPEDVRLASPMDEAFYVPGLLQQAGKAQHYAWCSKDLAQSHPEFVYSPDSATTEASAYLFGYLPLEAEWILEFSPGVNAVLAREVARHIAMHLALHVRRLCAHALYATLLYDGGHASSEKLQSAYIDLQERSSAFRTRAELFLLGLQDHPQPGSHLRALAFSFGLREYLRVRYGHRWWTSRKAGDELIDLWNTASRYSVEELARQIGFGDLSLDLLAEVLTTALAGA